MFWVAVYSYKALTDSMMTIPSDNSQTPVFFQVDKRQPMRLLWGSLLFIYVLQYPLSQLLPYTIEKPQYDFGDWLMAYGFVVISLTIFTPSLLAGMSGSPVIIYPDIMRRQQRNRRLGIHWVLLIFALFGLWSLLMLNYKIGMTIYTNFDPLPFRLTGLLFYGRIIIQPVVLTYIASRYAGSKFEWPLFALVASLGAWVCLTSGSRFASVVFAFPILFLFAGRIRYLLFGVAVLSFITVATLSRNYYLPFIINDSEILAIYANSEYLESAADNLLIMPFEYLVIRVMGIGEVLMTIGFGDISSGFSDSLQTFIFYFFSLVFSDLSLGATASVKNIYGLSDDSFGGIGLDLFSNYWVLLGGNHLLYFVGLVIIGWLFGRTYRNLAISLERISLRGISLLVFVLLFIMLFEARAFLFPWMFLLSWLLLVLTHPTRNGRSHLPSSPPAAK